MKHYTFKPLYTNRAGLKMLSINFYFFGVLFSNTSKPIQFYKNYY